MRLESLKGLNPSQIAELLPVAQSHLADLEHFAKLPFPDKKGETYRYADMKTVLASDLTLFTGEQGAIADDVRRIVIVDGVVTSAPAGVTIGFEESSETYAEHFDPLYYLSHALSPRVIIVNPGESSSVEIHHRYTRPGALITYRIQIKTAPNTIVQVYESFFDAEAKGSVILYGIDASIGRDATLHWVKNQTLGVAHSRVLASHCVKTETSATLDMSTYDFGSGQGLATVDVILGDYAVSQMHHLLYATESARRGIVSRVIHRGHHAHSTQTAKNILRHSARGIFDALIKVEHSAPKTIAHQNNRAILLDDGAYMVSKPQLEIYIDDLEASHGSTTGQLDEKALFYLRSRGIAEDEARKMLILAFANTLIDRIEDATLREWIHQSFEAVYYGQTHVECIATCHGCEEQTAGNAQAGQ